MGGGEEKGESDEHRYHRMNTRLRNTRGEKKGQWQPCQQTCQLGFVVLDGAKAPVRAMQAHRRRHQSRGGEGMYHTLTPPHDHGCERGIIARA